MFEKIKNFLKIKKKDKTEKTVKQRIDELFDSFNSEVVTIKIGEDIASFAKDLGTEIWEFRETLFENTGFIFPPVRILSSVDFQENEYQILLRDEEIFTGFSLFNQDDAVKEIVENLEGIYQANIEKFFVNEIMEKYLETMYKKNCCLTWNLLMAMPVLGIKLILINILQNGKSIKNIVAVFEKICEYATKNRDVCYKADPYVIADKVCSEL